jgi:hypothetical protein
VLLMMTERPSAIWALNSDIRGNAGIISLAYI